jgi:hypothetical protein
MNGGGDLSADRQPAAAESRRDCKNLGAKHLMRNAGFIRFMVGRAE